MSGNVLPIEQFDEHMADVTKAMREGSFKDALTECNDQIELGIQDNFFNRRTAEGRTWPARKQAWQKLDLEDGRKFDLSNPLLVLTSRLLQSATRSDSPDAVVEIHDRGMTRGTDVEYAAVHNYGEEGAAPGEGIPQREFMDVPEPFLKKCDDIIADHGLEMIFNP